MSPPQLATTPAQLSTRRWWERQVPAMPDSEHRHLPRSRSQDSRQDVSRSDPASGTGGYQSQGGNTCTRPEGPRPLPMSLSVGSSPAGVHGGLWQPWLMRKHRRPPLQEAKHMLMGEECQVLAPIVPASGPRDPGGGAPRDSPYPAPSPGKDLAL